MLRILPSGAIDPVFLPQEVDQSYPPGSINVGTRVPQLIGGFKLSGTDHYILYGRFNYFNDTLQPCITVVDDAGNIQSNYFSGAGATVHEVETDFFKAPLIAAVEELANGSLLIGGGFSNFMGHTHHNMIKLNRGTIHTSDHKASSLFSVFPNPADQWVKVELKNIKNGDVEIFDLSGRIVYQGRIHNELIQISTKHFTPGIYFINVKNDFGGATKKLIINPNHSFLR